MIDIHCHILPGIDDGASDLRESVEMAKTALADGITAVAATPHTQNGVYENAGNAIKESCDNLRKVFRREGIGLDLYPGAEVHLCRGMAEKIETGEILTINDNRRYLLLEFPAHMDFAVCKREIFELGLANIVPVIAHPERNAFFHFHFEAILELIELGCLVQITALSLTGGMGKGPAELSRKMVEMRIAHVIASDSHSPEMRSPKLSEAFAAAAKILGSEEEAEKLVTERPSSIVRGEGMEVPRPRTARKKGWLSFFRR